MKTAECRYCHETIAWVKTRQGKNMPIDPEPSKEGTLIIQGEDTDRPLALKMSREARSRYSGPLWVCHFDSCEARKRSSDEADAL